MSEVPKCTAIIHSKVQQEELQELMENMKITDRRIQVKYIFKKNPSCLPNNRETAVRIAASQERKLTKSGNIEYYHSEIKKYIDRGAVVKLSKEEIENWAGPTNYISHHGVERPLRIVTNSSLDNGGNSLNGCLIGGPNSLNLMINIALRFRC